MPYKLRNELQNGLWQEMLNHVCQVLPWCEDLLLLLDLQVALAPTLNSLFFTDGRFDGEIPPKGEIWPWKTGQKEFH